MSNDPKRKIPNQIQREVRQRCGFGCIMCGLPIYDYEHMKEWAKVKEHVAEDITLLCPQHHREKTAGRLPIELIQKHNKNPFNLRNGKSSYTPLYYQGDSCEFIIGGNTFKMDSQEFPNQMIPIMIDEIPLFSFILDKGHLLLSALVFDQFNNLILVISENRLMYSTDPWDIQFVGKTLTIREKFRKILLNITFDSPNKVIIDKARLLYNGIELLIKGDRLLVGDENQRLSRNIFRNLQCGIMIGREPQIPIGTGIYLGNINRYTRNSIELKRLAAEILE
ncbi:HNH endonuclease signature motif containing protein [Bacillus capparidis]|uniref:Trigger factor n=1 Tax=Bacillus capparidis TaxID=1840411 RepID=A0ABS4D1Q6_9BACI|nr:HNH endonuclease signature motif containing protein [Bacillus capparidis]MBP1083513.1 trigger factor [Bacillus capparidis]MED1094711.1 HNH endonuclease signature motif containing protein [Bacillus capparidis]